MLTDQVGDAVYIRAAANGFYKVAKADPLVLTKMRVFGVIIQKWNFTSALVQLGGEVRGIYSGLSPRRTYWVGPSSRPVLFSDLPPPAPGEQYFSQVLGMALDVGVLLLSPADNMTALTG